MADLIDDFYRQNAWANLRLLEICCALSDEQLDATAPGAFGSIRSTLTHLVGAEAMNLRRLGGSGPSIPSRSGEWPGFEVMREIVEATALGLIERAHAVGGSRIIVEEEPGRRFEIEADVLLVQVINHSTEHRSQICTILTVIGALPSTGDDGQTLVDAWAWSDANELGRRLS